MYKLSREAKKLKKHSVIDKKLKKQDDVMAEEMLGKYKA